MGTINNTKHIALSFKVIAEHSGWKEIFISVIIINVQYCVLLVQCNVTLMSNPAVQCSCDTICNNNLILIEFELLK